METIDHARALSANGTRSTAQNSARSQIETEGRACVESLKLQRLIALSPGKRSLFARAKRKLRELLAHGFSWWGIFLYFAERALTFLKRTVKSSIQEPHGVQGVTNARGHSEPVFVALRITGGVGDAVIVARWIAALSAYAKDDEYVVDLFYGKPGNIDFIFQKQCRIRATMEDRIFERVRGTYDLAGVANQFLTFHLETANWPKIVGRAPKLCAAVRTSEQKRQDFEPYIRQHPLLDGNFADAAVRIGCTRETFLHYQTGIPMVNPPLQIDVPDYCLHKFGLTPGAYLTVHDGWDAEYRLVATRPTKAYSPQSWKETVAFIKQDFPRLAVVQLGGKTGQSIPNVDLDLRNKTTLEEAAAIIQHAAAHIDTESGLVHLARCLGTPAVVLFGPTNPDYFAYDQNRNIVSESCGNCWWSTDSWMDACPRGFSSPICLDSIHPVRVAAEVSHLVRPQSRIREA